MRDGWLRRGRCPDVKKLLVDGFTTKTACPTGSFRVFVYPSGVDVSTSTLRYLSACLRTRRRAAGTQRPDTLYADRGYDHDKYRRRSPAASAASKSDGGCSSSLVRTSPVTAG